MIDEKAIYMRNIFERGIKDASEIGIRLVQDKEELFWLFKRVYEIQPKLYVQIGSFQGGCEIALSKACAKGATIISIDNGSEGRKGEPRIDAIKKAHRSLYPDGVTCHLIEGNSETAEVIHEYDNIRGNTLPDFVYVDGGHQYMQTLRDWMNYPVREGGLMAFHDINPVCNKEIETPRAWEYIKTKCKSRTEEIKLLEKNGGVGVIWK